MEKGNTPQELPGMEKIHRLEKELTELRQVGEKLRESEEFNRGLLTTLPDLVVRTDMQGHIIFVNDTGLKNYPPITKADLLGKNMLSFIDGKDLERAVENTRLMFEKPLGIQEYTINLDSDIQIRCEVNGDIIRDAGNNPHGMVYVIRDISKRKQGEESLKESEAFIRTIMDNLPIGIAVNSVGPEVEFLYMNDNFPRIYRTTRETLLRKDSFWEAVYEDPVYREKIKARVLTDVASGDLSGMHWEDIPITRKGKETRYIWARNIPVPGKNLFISTVWDVTDLKKTEYELRDSEERFRALHNASFGGILIHDLGRIIACNQGLSAVTGYTMEELLGMDGLRLFSEKCLDKVRQNINSGLEEPYEAIGLHKKGTEFPVRIEARNIPYKGKMVRVAEIRDISIQKKTERELIIAKDKAEASDKLKTAFINNISHEIRTPLNGILGFGQILSEYDLPLDQRKSHLEAVQKSSERLMQTVTNYIDISMLVSGTQEVNLSSFHLQPLVDEWLNHALALSADKDIQVKASLPDKPIVVHSDHTLIDKIMKMLLDNAVKFTSQGSILFGCKATNGQLEFFVHDTGVGISQERLPEVFQTFWQEETEDTRGHEGSGLGLAITKGLTELLGGSIHVISEKGKGASFFFTIPHEEEQLLAERGEEQADRPLRAGKPLVLVAEDDELNFSYIEVILETAGCDFLHAWNGEEAVEMCRQNPEISFVLMDIKMPVMNGLDATRKIRGFRPDIPVIALTAYVQSGDEPRILAAGCDEYLSKPVKPGVLTSMVKKYAGIDQV